MGTTKSPVEAPGGTPTTNSTAVVGHLTPVQLLVITAFALFVGEAVVMFILAVFGEFPTAVEAFLDATLLSILAAPILYLFLFRPIVMQIDERKAAERALVELNQELEHRVEARTGELARSNAALQNEVRERKATEERIRRTNDFVLRLIESAPCLMATIDVDSGACNYVNGRIFDFLGFSPDDVAGSGDAFLDSIFPPEAQKWYRTAVSDLTMAPEGEIVRGECRLRRADDSTAPFRIGVVVSSRSAIGEAQEILVAAVPLDPAS